MPEQAIKRLYLFLEVLRIDLNKTDVKRCQLFMLVSLTVKDSLYDEINVFVTARFYEQIHSVQHN